MQCKRKNTESEINKRNNTESKTDKRNRLGAMEQMEQY